MHVAAPQAALAPLAAPQDDPANAIAEAPAADQAVDVFEGSAKRQWAFVDAANVFPANQPENVGDGLDGLRGANNSLARAAQAEYHSLCPCLFR